MLLLLAAHVHAQPSLSLHIWVTSMLRQHALASIVLPLWHHSLAKPSLGAATSHGIPPMTPHLCAQGIVPLCQALGIPSRLTSLLLHQYASSKSLSVLQHDMALCPWVTKSSPCTKHCALVPPCRVKGHSWGQGAAWSGPTLFHFIRSHSTILAQLSVNMEKLMTSDHVSISKD